MHTQTREISESLSPNDALRILKEGNERFSKNLKANRDLLLQVSETSDGQYPFATILSCIDSRTSAELVFDQGLGDIFSVRIAGNCLNDDILGSLEFACRIAGAKLIMVLGHSRCGAIKGACDKVELGHLTGLLRNIQPAVESVDEPSDSALRTSANAEFVEAVARENVRRVVKAISERSEILLELKSAGTIDIVGGIYDVASGTVEILSQPSPSGDHTASDREPLSSSSRNAELRATEDV